LRKFIICLLFVLFIFNCKKNPNSKNIEDDGFIIFVTFDESTYIAQAYMKDLNGEYLEKITDVPRKPGIRTVRISPNGKYLAYTWPAAYNGYATNYLFVYDIERKELIYSLRETFYCLQGWDQNEKKF